MLRSRVGHARATRSSESSSRYRSVMSPDLKQSYRIDPAELPGEAVIFGCTAAMREIRNTIDCVLSSDLPVLIQGESGTGKEVIARFLHSRSNRREAPFVRLNCAAVPASLLESELFGREKEAYADAGNGRQGLVEIADGGTLFLDEIGDLPWDLQGKLLQLLQEDTYIRVGAGQERRGNVRVICATNIHLEGAVEAGKFRDDLFFRIDVVSLRLSALRDRKNDIPQLCEYFLRKLARQFGRNAPQLKPATLQLLKQWDWPGNMRELENWVARVIILGDQEALGGEFRRHTGVTGAREYQEPRVGALKGFSRTTYSAATNAGILKVLRANHWNRRKTAEDLKMSYRSLLHKLREVGMPQRRRAHRGLPPFH
jgi:two-component system, NtrC family, response regulator AtoC